jgi:hypothetical protein
MVPALELPHDCRIAAVPLLQEENERHVTSALAWRFNSQ